MIYVRRYLPLDELAVLRLAETMWMESPLHRPFPFSADKVRALLKAAIGADDWLALVARGEEDELVGFALVTVQPMFFSDAKELADLAIYVAQERRGGRAFLLLMRRIEEWARDNDAVVSSLGIATGIRHDRSLSAFMKLGYTPAGLKVQRTL